MTDLLRKVDGGGRTQGISYAYHNRYTRRSMAFSENLKRLRGEAGLSQELLAERIGVSRSAIAKWECGDGRPKIENLMRLRTVLRVPLDDLLLGEPGMEPERLPPVYCCPSCGEAMLRTGDGMMRCPVCGKRAFIGPDGALTFEP